MAVAVEEAHRKLREEVITHGDNPGMGFSRRIGHILYRLGSPLLGAWEGRAVELGKVLI